jgi:putative iron-dependent peroxidase
MLAQPLLAPLTPLALFTVVTIDDGGEQQVHDALSDLAGMERAIGFRAVQEPVDGDVDWIGSLGPTVLRPSPRRAQARRCATCRSSPGPASALS